MIIVKYKGGLGNQMFQYAMQLALEKQYGKQQVLADTSHYLLQNEHNGYELEKVWGIYLSNASGAMIKKLSPYYYPGKLFFCLPEGLKHIIRDNLQHKYKERKLKNDTDVMNHYYRQQDHCSYEPKVWMLEKEKDWYLDGLWQNIRYWEDVQPDIRRAFCFQNEDRYMDQDLTWKMQIESSCSISIHVRRGDFINSKFDICNLDYYEKAMMRLQQELEQRCVDKTDIRYFFFTDDVAYVAKAFQHITNKEIVRHKTEDAILDMELMSLCKHHIISNSTFAWWAAWLDEKKDTLVIGPSCSIRKPERDYPLSAPENWILLEV